MCAPAVALLFASVEPAVFDQAMVGTGEALLNVRARGGVSSQTDGKGAPAVAPSQEFDFQGELRKFDKVFIGVCLYMTSLQLLCVGVCIYICDFCASAFFVMSKVVRPLLLIGPLESLRVCPGVEAFF